MTRIALALVAAMLLLTPSLAEAQTVDSFERLGLVVNQGDRITVTDRNGQELEGRLMDLSPTALSLEIDNTRRSLSEADISVVRRRQRDSLKNGALLGFMSGVAIAAYQLRGAHPDTGVVVMSLFGGVGVGIGIGVDALVEGSPVVYRASRSARRLSITPLLSRDHRGLAVSLGF